MTHRSQAIRDVVAERERQTRDEGWSAEHDDAHASGQLARAAAAYALFASCDDAARALRATFVMDLVWAIWPLAWSRV